MRVISPGLPAARHPLPTPGSKAWGRLIGHLCGAVLWALLASACVDDGSGAQADDDGENGPTSLEPIDAVGSPPTSTPPETVPPTSAERDTGADIAATASLEDADCRFEPPAERTTRCWDLVVPSDRSELDAGEVRIHVALVASVATRPEPDPVVVLGGGPGIGMLETLRFGFEDRYAGILERRAVVVFDPRGVGASQPRLSCPEVALVDGRLRSIVEGRQAEAQQLTEATGECARRLRSEGARTEDFSTSALVDDVEALRVTLGVEQINLVATSYGTSQALAVTERRPDTVRSVVLDSAFGPEVDLVASVPSSAARAFDRLVELCLAESGCAARHDPTNAAEQLAIAADELDAEPLPVTFLDPDGLELQSLVDGDDLVNLVFGTMYARSGAVDIFELVERTRRRDPEPLAVLAALGAQTGDTFDFGAHLAYKCPEEVVVTDPERVIRQLTGRSTFDRLSASNAEGRGLFALCQAWLDGEGGHDSPAPRGASGPLGAPNPVPTFAFTGEFDPVTPPGWGLTVSGRSQTGYFREVPGQGHSLFGLECPTELTRRFIESPDRPPSSECLSAEGPNPFSPNREPVELISVDSGVGPVDVPAGWRSFQPDVWQRRESLLDPTTLAHLAPDGTAEALASRVMPEGTLEATPVEPESGGLIRRWSATSGPTGERRLDLAVVDAPGGARAVLLESKAAEADSLVDSVLIPAAERRGVSGP